MYVERPKYERNFEVQNASNATGVEYSWPNLDLPRCKIRGRMDKMSELIFRARTRAKPLIYFWHDADRQTGR